MAELNILSHVMLICFTILPFGKCEPHCSKFHYEGKLLEKMVRLEFKLEQFERGYKKIEEIIREERQKLQEDAVKSKEQMEESKTSIASQLGDLEDEVKLMGEKMLKDVRDATTAMEVSQQQNEAKITRHSADMRKFQNETITNLTNFGKISDVVFKAKDLVINNNDVFVFKTILQNEGEVYDAARGVFTAPVDGDYLFTTQLCIPGNTHIFFAFVVDDAEQKAMEVQSSTYTCGTGTLFSRLKKGARVWLKSKEVSEVHSESSANVVSDRTSGTVRAISRVLPYMPYCY